MSKRGPGIERIPALLKEDAIELADALASGRIALPDGRRLADAGLTPDDIEALASAVMRHVFTYESASVMLSALAKKKWLTLEEALIYSPVKSRTTLMEMIKDPSCLIYGTKVGGTWVIDRESIDAEYNKARNDVIAMAVKAGRETRHG